MDEDELIQEHEKDYNKNEQQIKDELKEVDRYILEREEFLERISKEQISLETEVINSMKNEYHQKIALLEKERRQLVKQRDESGLVEKNKFVNKIENLEQELKDYRKKAREQMSMEKQVESQKHKIRDLGEEIKKFKVQKVELHRKLKEDKDAFDRIKNKRIKELLQARKENMKKENEIRKERMKNYRKDQTVKHKEEEIKRIKRANEALKHFVKPPHKNKKDANPQNTELTPQEVQHFQKQQEELVFRICKQIAFEIDREQAIATLKASIQEDEKQLLSLIAEVSGFKIKKEKLDLKAEEEELSQEELEEQMSLSIIVKDLDENIRSLEDRISERQRSDILQ